MSYRYFRSKHRNWPARLGEVLGRKVELRKEIQTRGGEVFRAGTVMVVDSTHRGKLTLHVDGMQPDYGKRGVMIRQVWLSDVKLLPA